MVSELHVAALVLALLFSAISYVADKLPRAFRYVATLITYPLSILLGQVSPLLTGVFAGLTGGLLADDEDAGRRLLRGALYSAVLHVLAVLLQALA